MEYQIIINMSHKITDVLENSQRSNSEKVT